MLENFKLDYKDPESGISQRKKLEQVWDQTGVKPDQLKIEPLPSEVQYLYEIFYDLYNSEGITWNEIYHYQRVKGIELDNFELLLIRSTNNACASWMRDKMRPKKNKGQSKNSRAPKRPPAARRR